jgi:hypothetical protein
LLLRKEVNSTWRGCGRSKDAITNHKVQYSIRNFTRFEIVYIGTKIIIIDVLFETYSWFPTNTWNDNGWWTWGWSWPIIGCCTSFSPRINV